jgi:excisionase family DNA binding protein
MSVCSTPLPTNTKRRRNTSQVEPVLISVWDAARKLGVSRTTIYTLRNAGEITFVNIGRSARCYAPSVDALIERKLAAAVK